MGFRIVLIEHCTSRQERGHLGADPRSTAKFAAKEKEKKEKEITSSVTGTGEKKPQVGESSKESGKDEKRSSDQQKLSNKVSDFVNQKQLIPM